ncbi:glycosyltransferase family 2 protein [Paenibacillus sp. YYML68]|uniref:glycosyltransferase n=1 Tax=Paenibacillus sp. YYML68 TaxID=2909250 RepID=UPI00249121AE|nr:glycosyltransferase family 2 protein [Paenibacillus sp. YYML68]
MNLFSLLSLLSLAYWLYVLRDTLQARRWMYKLPRSTDRTMFEAQPSVRDQTQPRPSAYRPRKEPAPTQVKASGSEWPLVSIIVAAKEEEESISETVKHLLNQTYPRIEIIAVNDRSQDSTGRRLDELRRWSESRDGLRIPIRIIHITTLPGGWLGKNHALYQGYAEARGKYLLFTDADVLFAPDTVADAVAYMQREHADHVTLAPRIRTRSFWLAAFVEYFFFTFSLYVRPWCANADLQHKHGMGIGAFNLISRHAYEKIGTHRAFPLHPDDDLQLGRMVKRAKLRQRLASAVEHLEVEWYTSLDEAIRGLEKNLFSGFGYKLWLAALGVLGQLLLFFVPLVAWLFAPGWSAVAFGASALLLITVYVMLIRSIAGGTSRGVLVLPATVLLLTYVVIRSVVLTLRQGGIYWRGTFYSLKELRAMRRTDE